MLGNTSLLESHRESGAVIVLKEVRTTVDDGKIPTTVLHVVGHLLDDKAASDYTHISIPFNSYYQDAFLMKARTIDGGATAEVSPDAVQIKTVPGSQEYTDVRYLTFSLPALKKGSSFEYVIRYRQKTALIENQWFDRASFHVYHRGQSPRMDPVLKSRFALDLPEGEPFTYKTVSMDRPPVISRTGSRSTYLWEVKNLPPVVVESHMPPPHMKTPLIYTGSLKSWADLRKWMNSNFSPQIEVTPEIAATAREITGEDRTEKEKIRSVYYFIEKNIKYVGADLDRGGYKPHRASEVLRNRYGDCKDQAVLFVSLLRALNITAYPALVDVLGNSGIHENVPSPFFPHVIVCIPGKDGPLWLDTTGGVSTFPLLQNSDEGCLALILDGKAASLVRTPPSTPDTSRGRMVVTGGPTGKDYELAFTVKVLGEFNNRVKSMLRTASASQQKDTLAGFFARNYPPPHQVRDVTVSDVNDPKTPFTITGNIVFRGALDPIPRSFTCHASLLPLISLLTSLRDLPQPQYRKGDFWLDFPFTLVLENEIAPPYEGAQPLSLPQAKRLDTPYFTFRSEYARKGDSVHCTYTLVMKGGTVPRDRYAGFFKDAENLVLKSSDPIAFSSSRRAIEQAGLEAKVKKDDTDIKSLLNLSREYLVRGRYKEAKELLGKGLSLDPANGEVHYLLGVCLGYLDQYGESKAEMEKGKKLGYRP